MVHLLQEMGEFTPAWTDAVSQRLKRTRVANLPADMVRARTLFRPVRAINSECACVSLNSVSRSFPCLQVGKLKGRYNQPIHFLAEAESQLKQQCDKWEHKNPLNPAIDWGHVLETYTTQRTVVIDDLFSREALSDLWQYVHTQANFRCVHVSMGRLADTSAVVSYFYAR